MAWVVLRRGTNPLSARRRSPSTSIRASAHGPLLVAEAHTSAIATDIRSPAKQQIGPDSRQIQTGGDGERERAVDTRAEMKLGSGTDTAPAIARERAAWVAQPKEASDTGI
ncbi:MAG TPA: hypothetical protein VGW38_02545 [Chloroflexota bacterium]|nr:hypothetical protein [Chloroflexota bacterium]